MLPTQDIFLYGCELCRRLRVVLHVRPRVRDHRSVRLTTGGVDLRKPSDGRSSALINTLASRSWDSGEPQGYPMVPSLQRAFPLSLDDQSVDGRFAMLLDALRRASDEKH